MRYLKVDLVFLNYLLFYHICDRICENQPVSEKNKFFFIALLPFTSSGNAAVQI